MEVAVVFFVVGVGGGGLYRIEDLLPADSQTTRSTKGSMKLVGVLEAN